MEVTEIITLLTAIVGSAAATAALLTAKGVFAGIKATKKGVEAQIVLEMRKMYGSPEMIRGMRCLLDWKEKHPENWAQLFGVLRKEDYPKVQEEDEARRRFSHYFGIISIVLKHGLISEDVEKDLRPQGQWDFYEGVIKPLEKQLEMKEKGQEDKTRSGTEQKGGVCVESFILGLWSKIFGALRRVSVFQAIRASIPATKGNYGLVDFWVLGNLVFSIVCISVFSSLQIQWWTIVLLSYAGIRVFEIVIYQINVLLFDQYRAEKAGKEYRLGGYRRLVILLLHNYVEILLWYAFFYRHFACFFDSEYVSLNSLSGSLYFSLVTMSTLGYGDITPIKTGGLILIFTQTSVGIFIALLILARFISLLPIPGTLDRYEKRTNRTMPRGRKGSP